jgi:hypothetical protein
MTFKGPAIPRRPLRMAWESSRAIEPARAEGRRRKREKTELMKPLYGTPSCPPGK